MECWLPKINYLCDVSFSCEAIVGYTVFVPLLRWEEALNKAVEHCRKNNLTCGKLESSLLLVQCGPVSL